MSQPDVLLLVQESLQNSGKEQLLPIQFHYTITANQFHLCWICKTNDYEGFLLNLNLKIIAENNTLVEAEITLFFIVSFMTSGVISVDMRNS